MPRETKKGMLAWWGIIPTIAFIALQITFGWSEARIRATSPEFAISYLLGGVIAGPLISFVIALIVYFALRRSRLAATIVYSVVMALFCVAVLNKAVLKQARLRMAAAQAGPRSFPAVGITVTAPPGWLEVPPDRPGLIIRWISPDSSRNGEALGLVMVELKDPASHTAPEVARDLARSWGGRVSAQSDVMDGETVWRIQVDSPPPGLQPVEGLVAIRNGHLFLIEGGVSPGYSCHEQIESIRQSWRWIAIDSPVKHLEFRDQPLAAFGGQLSINFPAAMETFNTDHPERMLGLSLYNFKRNGKEFTALVQTGDVPAADTFEAAKDRLALGTQEKLKLPEAFVWHAVKGAGRRAITQPVRGPAEDGVNWIMWALIHSEDGRLVLINFSIYAQDPAERAAYAGVAEKMVESVTMPPRR